MKETVIIIRYSEIHLKGKNRGYFERVLKNNITSRISGFGAKLETMSGRYIVKGYNEQDRKKIQNILMKTAGIYSISTGYAIESEPEKIIALAIELMEGKSGTFKVDTNRADKGFQIVSMTFSALLGERILSANSKLKVDVVNPEITIKVDVRANGFTYLYFDEYLCVNGMPVGTSGKGLLLLSGGIDSPVAGYMMVKRGMKLSALHFESFPYTSPQAKQKAVELAGVLAEYNGNTKLYVANIASIQEAIHKNCHPDYMITLVRRFMLRIAERLSRQNDLQAIITGESLAQVASQTIESMSTIGSVLNSSTPLIKPLVGFDKQETISIAKKIGSYDISIKPYDDCCTVFLPQSPIIKPKIKKTEVEELKLDIETLVEDVLSKIEIIEVK